MICIGMTRDGGAERIYGGDGEMRGEDRRFRVRRFFDCRLAPTQILIPRPIESALVTHSGGVARIAVADLVRGGGLYPLRPLC